MLGRKEHAAVFIGQDRRFVCADFPCRVDDLFFVESDEGTQKRAGREVFGNVQIGDCLACNLSETFAGDDAVRVCPLCDEVCRFHHAHAEHKRRPRLRRFFFNAHLHVGKGNDIQIRIESVICKGCGETFNFFLRFFRRVRIRVKIRAVDFHTAPHHAVARDGRIDAA